MREMFFVIGRSGAILWSDAGDSAGSIPDKRERWEAIWKLREEIEELSHSHPAGPRGFSHEDETTMDALRAALGQENARRIAFSVVAPNGTVRRQNEHDEHVELKDEPWWANLLRRASGMIDEEEKWRS